MTGLMAGKRGLIMGLANDKSLAWGIAKALSEQGAQLAFSYQGDALAKRVRPLAEQLGSDLLIDCDVADMDKLDAAFDELKARWGTLDFVVHAIGFSDKNELRGKYVDTSTTSPGEKRPLDQPNTISAMPPPSIRAVMRACPILSSASEFSDFTAASA